MRTEVSTLFGVNVYTDKGVYVGRVDDVILDPNESKISGLAIGKINQDMFDATSSKGVVLPYRWVTAVGDVILIKQVFSKFKKKIEDE
ncbi:MAG: PRC-barrel domain-containing protein [Euryarchaeota archaeon]|nr:PRC-barrel domain-containing protein [Euryarchaeota archaeon]